ncbi:hypothetical protein [Marmoricola sp. Leaf446]|uniref:hypothetical protein n=1 Tax=Marmoricola sp. Leaf446 TaxID=1736379 RepID=UPI0012E33747|nr:hypothetical protein [Marmoricola sp. Leaf446]
MTSAARFIAVFNDIENHLRDALAASPRASFKSMLDDYASQHRLPARHKTALETFARLRNAISHGRYQNGLPIADPRPDTLEQIEQIRDLLLSPPLALEAIYGPVDPPAPAVVGLQDPISVALVHVRDHDYSQLPIYDGDLYLGLLTANTIARWISQQFDDFDGEAVSESVAFVHRHQEAESNVVPARLDLTALEVIDLLANLDHPANAVIFSPGGTLEEPPTAIAVPADLDALYRSLNFR